MSSSARSRAASVSRAAAGGSRAAAGRVRAAARAHGAGETGLSQLIGLHAVSSAGDALVAVSLAGTLFFGVPVGQARTKVALYLLLTMAPFAGLAPVIGPALDRVRRGRRLALALTLLGRGLLAWAMARALVTSNPATLYPAAFGVLILTKAYGVSRSAMVPRLTPPTIALVRANARVTLAGLILATLAGSAGAGLTALVGPAWTLRVAAAVFIAGSFLAFWLPAHVDSSAGELPLRSSVRGPLWERLQRGLGPSVTTALGAAVALRALNGFLTMFLAFLIRAADLGGSNPNLTLGLVIGAAAVGGLVGTALGDRLPARQPEALVLASVAAAAVTCAVATARFELGTVMAVAVVTGLAQAVSKLGLDALIQRDVPEQVRSSAFARSESVLQLSWVLGGLVGIVLPLRGGLGLGFATAGLLTSTVLTVRGLHRTQAGVRRARAT